MVYLVKQISHAKYFFCCIVKFVTPRPTSQYQSFKKWFWWILKLLCDINFKDNYKILILVCVYTNPKFTKKNGTISIMTNKGYGPGSVNLVLLCDYYTFICQNIDHRDGDQLLVNFRFSFTH